MAAKIIDGIAIAAAIRAECRADIERLRLQQDITPGLAVILVGADPASQVYVRNKITACANVGIRSFRFDYPARGGAIS